MDQQNLNIIQFLESNLVQADDQTLQIENQNQLNSNNYNVIDSQTLQLLYNAQQQSNTQQQSINNITDNNINTHEVTTTILNNLSTPQKPRTYTRPPKKPLTPYMIFSKQVIFSISNKYI